jgi:hypothetical protein
MLSNVMIDRESLARRRRRKNCAVVAGQPNKSDPAKGSSFPADNDDSKIWPFIPFPDGWCGS